MPAPWDGFPGNRVNSGRSGVARVLHSQELTRIGAEIMQPTRPANFSKTLRRALILSLLLALAGMASGCGRLQNLSAAPAPRGGACDQGLLAVGAWKCLSGGLRTASLAADPAAGPVVNPTGGAAAGTARP